MKKPVPVKGDADPNWRNLRDSKGRLYGRIDRVRMLLELRSHNGQHETVVFELKTYIEISESETKVAK